MRAMKPAGVCACCGSEGPVWTNDLRVLDFGTGLILEPDTSTPDLCDDCDYAQRRWDARQHEIRCVGAGYPYFDAPPRTPPFRRPGDRDLAADGWPE